MNSWRSEREIEAFLHEELEGIVGADEVVRALQAPLTDANIRSLTVIAEFLDVDWDDVDIDSLLAELSSPPTAVQNEDRQSLIKRLLSDGLTDSAQLEVLRRLYEAPAPAHVRYWAQIALVPLVREELEDEFELMRASSPELDHEFSRFRCE